MDKTLLTVLGAVLALKMVAYVGLSPVIAAFAHRIDRRRLLITLDLVREVAGQAERHLGDTDHSRRLYLHGQRR